MVKRLTFVAVIILLYNIKILGKIVILLCIQLADTIFIFLSRPSNLARYNIIECSNQLFLLTTISLLIKINNKTDWTESITDTFIYFFMSNSLISLLIILSSSILDLIKWCNKKDKQNQVWTKKPRGFYMYGVNNSNRPEEAKSKNSNNSMSITRSNVISKGVRFVLF